MSEIYEVVIFTAAMQDVRDYLYDWAFSMLIGSLIRLTRRSASAIACTDSMLCPMGRSS